jgi:hypothetical protein
MSIRLTRWLLAVLGLPLVALVVGLIVHPALWTVTNPRHARPALVLIGAAIFGLIGWLASHSDALRDRLSMSGWRRFQYVRSSPAQASVVMFAIRWGSVAMLWGAALLSVTGHRLR